MPPNFLEILYPLDAADAVILCLRFGAGCERSGSVCLLAPRFDVVVFFGATRARTVFFVFCGPAVLEDLLWEVFLAMAVSQCVGAFVLG